jgi:hypothetical protein
MTVGEQPQIFSGETIARGKKVMFELEQRKRTGKPLNEVHQRIIDTSFSIWALKHPLGEAGLFAYAAIVSRPDDLVEMSTPSPYKQPLKGKQSPVYRAKYLTFVGLLRQAYDLLPGAEGQSHDKRRSRIAVEFESLLSKHRNGKPLSVDGFREPLARAVRMEVSKRLGKCGVKKALK